ncbi:MAG: sigma-54 dependent transcriptional regulator [Candidatus Ratteibacteria bacterium]|jgi:DNA-binding NtrC family response regulator
MKKILIIDDEKNVCEALRMLLKDDYKTSVASNGREGLKLLEEDPQLVILDVIMPDMNGLEVLQKIRQFNPDVPVIMLSAVDRVKTVVEAMRLGAVDYIAKPFESEELKLVIQKMLDYSRLREKVEYLQTISRDYREVEFVGRSAVAQKVLQEVSRVARTPSSVLITGESGTGKEVVAKLIHYQSSSADKPFIAVHCAALPENLFESELFGYEKGAFTDALEKKAGMFDLAKDGTIFLDEIGEMLLTTQVKLLRVLQEREFLRLGGTKLIKTEARVLAATSKDLDAEIEKGGFRQDLYYRLNVVTINIPPLRERREDIPLLVDHFFAKFQKTLHVTTKSISDEAKNIFQEYGWPGNVRELKNVIERILVLHGDVKVIQPGHLAESLKKKEPDSPSLPSLDLGKASLEEAVNKYETVLIKQALEQADGVVSQAAKILKTTRRILSYRMKKLDLPL